MSDPTAAPAAPPTDPAGTAGAPPADPTAGAPAAPPAEPSWLDALDASSKSYAEARGFKSAVDVVTHLKGYEPPESPDAYELPVPDGESPEFAKAVAPLMHAAKLSPTQAKELAAGWNAMQAEQRAAAEAAQTAAATEAAAVATRQAAELKTEWGAKHDANLETARRAAQSFVPGATADEKGEFLSMMESRFGYTGMMKFWAQIGEHMTPAQAAGLGQPPAQSAVSFYENSKMNP